LWREFAAPQLNQASDTLAFLVLPASACLIHRGRTWLSLMLAMVTLMVIYGLVGTVAKLALGVGIVLAVLLYVAPRHTARLAAILCVLIIITAPLTFARLAQLQDVTEMAETVKFSAWHRLMIWSFAGDRIAERPLGGWASTRRVRSPRPTSRSPRAGFGCRFTRTMRQFKFGWSSGSRALSSSHSSSHGFG